MIYTIMPIDAVLNNQTDLKYDYCEKTIDGQLVQLNKNEDGKYSLIRVISTDPQAFLSKKFQPGIICSN